MCLGELKISITNYIASILCIILFNSREASVLFKVRSRWNFMHETWSRDEEMSVWKQWFIGTERKISMVRFSKTWSNMFHLCLHLHSRLDADSGTTYSRWQILIVKFFLQVHLNHLKTQAVWLWSYGKNICGKYEDVWGSRRNNSSFTSKFIHFMYVFKPPTKPIWRVFSLSLVWVGFRWLNFQPK